MTVAETLLLALALCIDSLVVSAAAAMANHLPLKRRLLMAVTFALFQGTTPLLGALLGEAFKSVAESIDHWIAFGLLAALGGKMVADALHHGNDNSKNLNVNHFGVICALALATSIDAFVVGIPLGLQYSAAQVLLTAAAIGLCTLAVSLLGSWLGSRRIPVPERTANIVAGIALILLGSKILIEHLWLQ